MKRAMFAVGLIAVCACSSQEDGSTDDDAALGDAADSCAGLDESACKTTPGCLSASGLEHSTGKIGFAGCVESCDVGMPGLCVIAPNGSCWSISGYCYPEGWPALGASENLCFLTA